MSAKEAHGKPNTTDKRDTKGREWPVRQCSFPFSWPCRHAPGHQWNRHLLMSPNPAVQDGDRPGKDGEQAESVVMVKGGGGRREGEVRVMEGE